MLHGIRRLRRTCQTKSNGFLGIPLNEARRERGLKPEGQERTLSPSAGCAFRCDRRSCCECRGEAGRGCETAGMDQGAAVARARHTSSPDGRRLALLFGSLGRALIPRQAAWPPSTTSRSPAPAAASANLRRVHSMVLKLVLTFTSLVASETLSALASASRAVNERINLIRQRAV